MDLKEKLKYLKINKKKIGLVHGVFDILHIGHIWYFQEAKKKVDYLIVSVTTDKYVNKGPGKPIFNIKNRTEMLKTIRSIDYVVESKNESAIEVIKLIKPDFYIKGKDYKNLNNDLSKKILQEKKEVERYGGKIIFTDTDLLSSSSITNNYFNYLNEDCSKLINSLNKELFEKKFKKLIKSKLNNKILIIGDPILDIMRFVEPSGKANKNTIIATRFTKEELNAGGVLLIINYLNNFFRKIDFLNVGQKKNINILKKITENRINFININAKNNIIKKIRYVDSYSGNRLFQVNYNEKNSIEENIAKKVINFIKKNKDKYDKIVVFDYGYILSNKIIKNYLNTLKKKLVVNCQSNSFNYGFNLANQFKRGYIISMDENEYRLVVQDKYSSLETLVRKNLKIFSEFEYFIVTQGKMGCYIVNKKKILFVPTILKPSIDSTGSGDIFLSTFLVADMFNNFSNAEKAILSHIAAGIHANSLGNRLDIKLDVFKKVLSASLK